MKRAAPQLLIADTRGAICVAADLEPAGMKGEHLFRLSPDDLIKMPQGGQLFLLPHRNPAAYDPRSKDFLILERTLHGKGSFAVAAFVPPGYTSTYSAAYREGGQPKMLPLFSYTAVCVYKNAYHIAAVRVDTDRRHDTRSIDIGDVRKNAARFKKIFRTNRLVRHLEECALDHGCPGAQNFFLQRYEGPLPSSPTCNARCAGCISYQPSKECPQTQPRIKFIPTPDEIAEIALFHMNAVKDPVVSFGQGCDGEPLNVSGLIEKSIRLIRSRTGKGMINMNTNASRPESLARLFDAGLDSIRVSLNSARAAHYTRYYRPRGYAFRDVVRSMRLAKSNGRFVSLNYLTMPGFTDSRDEFSALEDLIGHYKIDMIQWRNLNFDPQRYFRLVGLFPARKEMIGIREMMGRLQRSFPKLMMGYFNPTKSKISSNNKAQMTK